MCLEGGGVRVRILMVIMASQRYKEGELLTNNNITIDIRKWFSGRGQEGSLKNGADHGWLSQTLH